MAQAPDTSATRDREVKVAEIKPLYFEAVGLIEKLHRRLIDVIRDGFDRLKRDDITADQALFLYTVGEGETTLNNLRVLNLYPHSFGDYNLKKLTECGFLNVKTSGGRRNRTVSLTAKGREVRDMVGALYANHARTVEAVADISGADLAICAATLRRLESFWRDQIAYRL